MIACPQNAYLSGKHSVPFSNIYSSSFSEIFDVYVSSLSSSNPDADGLAINESYCESLFHSSYSVSGEESQ